MIDAEIKGLVANQPLMYLVVTVISLVFMCIACNKSLLNKYPKLFFIFARMGVSIHELSHYFVAKILLHRVSALKMYQKPTAKGRPLGYVIHEPRIAFLAPITNLLIGIAPFFGGVLVAFLVTKEIVPELLYLSVFEVTLKHLQAIGLLRLMLWLVFTSGVLIYSIPSRTDVKNGRLGATILIALSATAFYFNKSIIDYNNYNEVALKVASTLTLLALPVTVLFLILLTTSLPSMLKNK